VIRVLLPPPGGPELLGMSLRRHAEIAASRAGLVAVETAPRRGEVIVVAPGTAVTADMLAATAAAPRTSASRYLAVEGAMPVGTRAERRRAGDALVRAACKKLRPDDYIGAFTRELTIPMVRVLAPTGISPNAITVIGFILTAASAVPFALGGYGWMLLGAVLFWLGSMADCVDGKLARVTDRITPTGSRLDARSDEVSYVLLFVAIPIGLARDHTPATVLAVAGLAVVGLVAALAIIAGMRRRLDGAGGVPFGARVYQTLSLHKDDPLLGFAYHTIRVATRAGMPHFILLFALFGRLAVLAVVATAVAHITWICALRLEQVVELDGAKDAGVKDEGAKDAA